MNKKLITILVALSLSVSMFGCTKQSSVSAINTVTTQTEDTSDAKILSNINISSGKTESVGEADTFIELGENISIKGDGATVDNKKITITSAGTYSIKGTLTEGQIIVNAGDDDKVYIILDGVNITCSNNAPIYVKNSKKTIVSLADNTENSIKDGENYIFEDSSTDEPNAAIFSKSDLIFIGNGSLVIDAKYNNGITSKDDLKIESGNIIVNAKADGLRGKDSVVITNGNIIINSGEDGIKSNNDEDSEKGYVLIEGGKINITSGKDGIQAETNAFVKEGDIIINTGGGSENASAKKGESGGPGMEKQLETSENTAEEESISTKAIKAGINIITEGGTFNIDACDDAIHSNNNLVINAGTFNLSSGDDGLHSDSTLTINNGSIDVKKSYEGIESETITINDGEIMVLSSDDGINASGGNDSSGIDENMGKGAPPQMDGRNASGNSQEMTGNQAQSDPQGAITPGGSSSGNGIININGGHITINSNGDGIDSNGLISMKGGTAIVNGPTNDGNASLDYDGSFNITGGNLIAAGSSGMAQAPSKESTQNSVKITLASQSANTLIRIESESGEEIITFAPSKQYSSVVVSSPKFKSGETYKVYLNGSSTGTVNSGIYTDGVYTKGKEIGSFTISGTVSEVTQDGVTVTNRMGGGRGQGGMKSPKQ
ncbi:hypothetical protein CLPUN_47090 [Clostridium puniceum]|uniref:Carbohydrate-binding domain-containing protein n=1 Tax=Clostridium puniceum TaxID=29367 RepID=A0A1S8T3Q4_9CLOT|nr:carbohydrate-binding domain-containing protein [Clostridium puniceum]OOM72241.1 hypothetical protein CLPUN_47090 [Clostridium puniceum]